MKLNRADSKKIKEIVRNNYNIQKKEVNRTQKLYLNEIMSQEFKSKRLVTELIKDFTNAKYDSLIKSLELYAYDFRLDPLKSKEQLRKLTFGKGLTKKAIKKKTVKPKKKTGSKKTKTAKTKK